VAWRITLPARILLLARTLTALLLTRTLIGVLGLLALVVLTLVRLPFGHSVFSSVEPSNVQTTPRSADRFSSDVEIARPLQGANVTAEQFALQRKTAGTAQLSRIPPCCCSSICTVRK